MYVGGPEPRTLYLSHGCGSGGSRATVRSTSFQYGIRRWRSVTPWIKAEIFNVFHNDEQIAWNTVGLPDSTGPTDDLIVPIDFLTGPRFGQATSVDHFPRYVPGIDSPCDDLLRRSPAVVSRCSLMEH